MLGEIGEVWFCSNKNCNTVWYIDIGKTPNFTTCQKCGGHPIKSILMTNEYYYIKSISEDRDFIDAMIELKQKDIIEFKTKIAQFKAQVNTQNESMQQNALPKCPTCQSTNIRKIGTGERVASVVGFGLLSKKINKTWKCNNCGYTW